MTIFDYIPSIVAASNLPVFLEIGAARGEDTQKLIDLVGTTKTYEYYAFEPDPRNIKSIKDNPVNKKVHLIPAAIGDKNIRTKFNQSSGTNPAFGYEHTLSGSLKQPVEHLAAHTWCKFETQCDVRMMTLDSFCDVFSVPKIDFIWCDVQGAEDLVIAGAQNALRRTRFFYTEYYENQMYQGQIGALEILNRLPGVWRMVQQWNNDVLFENAYPWQPQKSA